MNDYIKREDAIAYPLSWDHYDKKNGNRHFIAGVESYREYVGDLPTTDVVEVDKAQKEIDYWHDKAQSYEQTILKLSLNKADVVEVIRCKDCKYQRRKWHDDKRFQDGGYFIVGCMRNGDPFVMHTVDGHDTDFCSYGERADT